MIHEKKLQLKMLLLLAHKLKIVIKCVRVCVYVCLCVCLGGSVMCYLTFCGWRGLKVSWESTERDFCKWVGGSGSANF